MISHLTPSPNSACFTPLKSTTGMERDLRYISVFVKEEEREAAEEDTKVQMKKVKEEFANSKEREEIIGILLNEPRQDSITCCGFHP